MLLARDRSVLLVVDAQARLVPALSAAEPALRNLGILIETAKLHAVPTLATEQYPNGLGATVPEIAERLAGAPVVEKLAFGAMGEPAFREALAAHRAQGRDQIVVAGFEAHVCVLQTALGLVEASFHVAVVADAVASRRPLSVDVALRRMERAGVTLVTAEMVAFEWTERAGTDVFKAVAKLVR